MNRRNFILLTGGALAASIVPKAVIEHPIWMGEETPLILPTFKVEVPKFRTLIDITGEGLSTVPGTATALVTVARQGSVLPLLMFNLNLYGGWAQWWPGSPGQAIYETPEAPLLIGASSPWVAWTATYRNSDNTYERIGGYGSQVITNDNLRTRPSPPHSSG